MTRFQTVLVFLSGLALGFIFGVSVPRACVPIETPPDIILWPYLTGPDWQADTFTPTDADFTKLQPLVLLICRTAPDLTIWEQQAVAGTLLVACDTSDTDPLLLAQIARFESTFNPYAVNRATGCYGMMQWMKRWHKGKFTDAGLNWDSPTDQCRMAAERIQLSVSAGKTIRQALAPWTVRDRAIKAWEAGNGS